jgi:hypothetical protein
MVPAQAEARLSAAANEGHAPVPRRPVNGHAALLQSLACLVNVVDLEREMTEVPAAAIDFRIPVIGELDLGAGGIARRPEEDQRVAPRLDHMAAHFLESQLVAVEVERLVDVADPDHGVKKSHGYFLLGSQV